jgi:hypothetical protein
MQGRKLGTARADRKSTLFKIGSSKMADQSAKTIIIIWNCGKIESGDE